MKQLIFLVVISFYSTSIWGRNIRKNHPFIFYNNYSANGNYSSGNLERETLQKAEYIPLCDFENVDDSGKNIFVEEFKQHSKEHHKAILEELADRKEELDWVLSDLEYEAEVAGEDISKCVGGYISEMSDMSTKTENMVKTCVNEKVEVAEIFVKNELYSIRVVREEIEELYNKRRKCFSREDRWKTECLNSLTEEMKKARYKLFEMLHQLGQNLEDITLNFKPTYLRHCSTGLIAQFAHSSEEVVNSIKTCVRDHFGTLYIRSLNWGIQVAELSIKTFLTMIFVQLMLNLF